MNRPWAFRFSIFIPLVTSGFLLLSFHPFNISWVLWVALVPWWVWLLHPHRSRRQAVLGSMLVGLVYYVGISVPFTSLEWWGWGSISTEEFPAYQLWQRVFMLGIAVALSAWGAVFWGAFGWLMHRHAKSPWTRLVLLSACWTLLIEYVPHLTIAGLSWGLLGYRLHEAVLIRQVASLAGIYGLGFLIAFVNASVTTWALAVQALEPAMPMLQRPVRHVMQQAGRTMCRPPVRGTVGVGVLVILAAFGYGAVSVNRAEVRQRPAIKAAALQGNVLEYAVEDLQAEGFDATYGPMVDKALHRSAEIIVLPESVWFHALQRDGTRNRWVPTQRLMSMQRLQQRFAEKLRQSSSLIIHGMDTIQEGRVYNALDFWTAGGLHGVYFKRTLVPFSEFRPPGLGWLAPQNRLHGSGFEYTAGDRPNVVSFRTMPIGGLICHEVMFPRLVRESVLAGAQLLVSAGNDGMFKDPVVAEEQAVMARFRAIEQHRYLIRSMKSGVSAIVDPWGRELARVPVGNKGIATASVRAVGGLSPYARWGDWMVWVAGLLAVGVLLVRPRATAAS